MTITDKTRKILWGKSGNRCAICKHELVIGVTEKHKESVVADECHIVSSQINGPRYDQTFAQNKIDDYDNLILLCRTHHKMVDDQHESYSTNILRQMKTNHELWVSEKLTNTQEQKPFRIYRVKKNIPAYLSRITSGNELTSLLSGSYVLYSNNDELRTKQEVELLADFWQTLQDFLDLGSSLELSDRVKAAFGLTQSLGELESAGFFVFGAKEIQKIEGGIGDDSNWPVIHISILRNSNEVIIDKIVSE
jgi:hypothetical protein